MSGLSQGLNLTLNYSQKIDLTIKGRLDAPEGTCTNCGLELSEEEIRAGWKKDDPSDYTTKCPNCNTRFLAYFRLLEEDQEIAKYEFLSPFHLFIAMEKIWIGLPGKSNSKKIGKTFLQKKDPLVFWNLIRYFGTYAKGRAAFSKYLKTPATTKPPSYHKLG